MWRSPGFLKWLLVFLISAVFTVAGAWFTFAGRMEAWLVVFFFGACGLVALNSLIPAANASAVDSARRMLGRFPGPVLLSPSRLKWLVLLIASMGFAAAFLGLALEGHAEGWPAGLMWTGAIFFGLGIPVAAVHLSGHASSLRLDADGFEVANLFQRRRTRWRDASGFQPIAIPPANILLVGYEDENAETGALAGVNRAIAGSGTVLPDTYGLPPDVLAELMRLWRERALDVQKNIG